MKIDEIKEISKVVCPEFDVKRLDVFGSMARGTSTDSSDIDLLVEFRDPEKKPAKRFFGLLHRLEDQLGCHIDLLTPDSLRNPYFRKRVLQERMAIYEG